MPGRACGRRRKTIPVLIDEAADIGSITAASYCPSSTWCDVTNSSLKGGEDGCDYSSGLELTQSLC
jgi:hypothetical protein